MDQASFSENALAASKTLQVKRSSVARLRARSKKTHRVYVVQLDAAVLKHRRLLDANPGYVPGARCVYVGVTGLQPRQRLAIHRRGHKANAYVRRYGVRLVPELYAGLGFATYSEALQAESTLAASLRELDFAVWQG